MITGARNLAEGDVDDVVSELLAATSGFLVPLRQGLGIDAVAFERLERALLEAARCWAKSASIPKAAANLLVDLAPAIRVSGDAYGGEIGAELYRLADEIADLVRDCVKM